MCWYWLNLGNHTFSPRKAIVDLPATISQKAAVRGAGLNGNGAADLVYADSQLLTEEHGESQFQDIANRTGNKSRADFERVMKILFALSFAGRLR